jgi:glutamate racemase
MKKPIAIFDSGLGGLTVAKEIHRLIPQKDIVYVGDTARVPYGTKSSSVIKNYAKQITGFLLGFNPQLIVVACHSVSSLALNYLKVNFPGVCFIDVVTPSVEKAAAITKNRKIGVIGTLATISSGKYQNLIRSISPGIKVFPQACPLFVPLVEEGWLSGEIPERIVRKYISGLIDTGIDTLILGCTHYPLLKTAISAVAGNSIKLVDASEVTGKKVKAFLQKKDLLGSGKEKVPVLYFTDIPPHHKKLLTFFWRNQKLVIRRVTLEKHV